MSQVQAFPQRLGPAATEGRVPAFSWVALGVLVIVAILNFMDRTLIGILQIPLKTELHLSDLQLGALVGTAFGLVYTLFGLPIGLLADRTNRKWVLVAAIVIWTSLTAACGWVTGFTALLVCRMGVALGEAACAPVSHSMISDLFLPRRRAVAVSLWALGVPVGEILGFLFAGGRSTSLGWRRSFISIGMIDKPQPSLPPWCCANQSAAPARKARRSNRRRSSVGSFG